MPEPRLVAVTVGDSAGIGPEVVMHAVALIDETESLHCLIIGHPQLLRSAAETLQTRRTIESLTHLPEHPGDLRRLVAEAAERHCTLCFNPAGDQVLNAPRRCVSAESGDASFQYLRCAIQLAKDGRVDSIATAPLNKESLYRAGHHYPGHTEILAEHCGVSQFAMMLHLPESKLLPLRQLLHNSADSPPVTKNTNSGHGLSVAHVTLHTSICSVPTLLTQDGIVEKIRLMDEFLTQMQCPRRSIAVCALNPHGGEHGLFGDEEARLIEPAVEAARAFGTNVTGPLPVDTLFRRAVSGEFDGVVAMYHDQGHIPVKLIGFDAAVNITLGLPIIRTSPTHGTAFDRAWNPATPADPSGMIEAIRMAAALSTGSVSSSESHASAVSPARRE